MYQEPHVQGKASKSLTIASKMIWFVS